MDVYDNTAFTLTPSAFSSVTAGDADDSIRIAGSGTLVIGSGASSSSNTDTCTFVFTTKNGGVSFQGATYDFTMQFSCSGAASIVGTKGGNANAPGNHLNLLQKLTTR